MALAGRGLAPTMERSAPAPRLAREVVLQDHRPEQNRTQPLPDSLIKLQAVERANQLRDFNEAHQDPREALKRTNKSIPPLSDTESKQLAKIDPTLAKEAKQFDDYSVVVDEARRTHRSLEDVCAEHQKKDSEFTNKFNDSQNATIDRMMKADYVTDRIPGFTNLQPESSKRAAVEAYVAAHPKVREKYISEVRIISREALKLAEDPTEAGKKAQSERSAQLQTDRMAEEAKVKGKLGKQGETISETDIEQAFDGDKSVAQAEMELLDKVLEKNGIKPAKYNTYQEQQRLHTLEREFQGAHKKGPQTGKQFDLNKYVGSNENDPRVAEFKKLQARNQGDAIVFSTEDQQIIKTAEDAIFGEVRYIRGVSLPIGGVHDELQKIHDNLRNARQTETQKQNIDPEAQAKVDGERAALKDKLNGAMEKSVDEALLESYDELQEINNRKVEAEKEDADVTERKAIDAINDNQKVHGIKTESDGINKGKKIINRTDIGKDVQRLAQDGDKGLRRLVLRNLTEGSDSVIKLTDENGNPRYFVDKDGKPCESNAPGAEKATWETINEGQLPQEERNLLNKMHETQGDRLAQTILVDYFFAQKPPIKGVVLVGDKKSLTLTDAQQADLIRFVGGDNIQNFYQESREYSMLRDVIGKIQANPDNRNGLLMMLLSLFASIGTLGGLRKKGGLI